MGLWVALLKRVSMSHGIPQSRKPVTASCPGSDPIPKYHAQGCGQSDLGHALRFARPDQVIKIQAVRRGVIGRRYAKEHKRHVSAARWAFIRLRHQLIRSGTLRKCRERWSLDRLQSLVRTRKEQRIYDALRPFLENMLRACEL